MISILSLRLFLLYFIQNAHSLISKFWGHSFEWALRQTGDLSRVNPPLAHSGPDTGPAAILTMAERRKLMDGCFEQWVLASQTVIIFK